MRSRGTNRWKQYCSFFSGCLLTQQHHGEQRHFFPPSLNQKLPAHIFLLFPFFLLKLGYISVAERTLSKSHCANYSYRNSGNVIFDKPHLSGSLRLSVSWEAVLKLKPLYLVFAATMSMYFLWPKGLLEDVAPSRGLRLRSRCSKAC